MTEHRESACSRRNTDVGIDRFSWFLIRKVRCIYYNTLRRFDSVSTRVTTLYLLNRGAFAFKLPLSLSVEIHSLMAAIRYLFV